MFDSKKLAASCAAVASLAMFGLTGTAMAVETPTTSDTATASITLNASEGNTLAGTRSRSTVSARTATSPPAHRIRT